MQATRPRAVRRRQKKKPGGSKLGRGQIEQVKRIVHAGEELKYFDVLGALAGITSAGAMSADLSLIPQGAAENQRVGEQVEVRRIKMKLQLTAGDATNMFRIVLFRWNRNTNIGAPIINDISEQIAVNPTQFFINHDNQRDGQFTIVWDKTVSMVLASQTAQMIFEKEFTQKHLKKKFLNFNTAVNTGVYHYFLCAISDSIAAPNPSWAISFRTEYVDA